MPRISDTTPNANITYAMNLYIFVSQVTRQLFFWNLLIVINRKVAGRMYINRVRPNALMKSNISPTSLTLIAPITMMKWHDNE